MQRKLEREARRTVGAATTLLHENEICVARHHIFKRNKVPRRCFLFAILFLTNSYQIGAGYSVVLCLEHVIIQVDENIVKCGMNKLAEVF